MAAGATMWTRLRRPNARPHQAVRVAPEDVETMPAASFRVYQDNAQKFKHNDELTRSRQRRLEEAGAGPPPMPRGHSSPSTFRVTTR